MLHEEILTPENNLVQEALALIETDPQGAALKLDELATKIKELADQLRNTDYSPFVAVGSMKDRVRIQVLGPHGELKQEVDSAPTTVRN